MCHSGNLGIRMNSWLTRSIVPSSRLVSNMELPRRGCELNAVARPHPLTGPAPLTRRRNPELGTDLAIRSGVFPFWDGLSELALDALPPDVRSRPAVRAVGQYPQPASLWSLSTHFFTRNCTRVPSGNVPFNSCTVPLRTIPSNSCCDWSEVGAGAGITLRPAPLFMASFARRSAS